MGSLAGRGEGGEKEEVVEVEVVVEEEEGGVGRVVVVVVVVGVGVVARGDAPCLLGCFTDRNSFCRTFKYSVWILEAALDAILQAIKSIN